MTKKLVILRTTLEQSGRTYEDTYSGWLEKVFKPVAEANETVQVYGAPMSWVPLLTYLGAKCLDPIYHFKVDTLNAPIMWPQAVETGLERECVESTCALRPELADALWLSDMKWKTKRRKHTKSDAFVVTNNGSFHRPEVLSFMERLDKEILDVPSKEGIVLVPCAADKPYPAPLHKAVRKCINRRYYRVAVVTGVLGVVPEEMWKAMPNYDSGVPNRWRVMEAVEDYFYWTNYEHVIVYSDFYSEAISIGLRAFHRSRVSYPLEEAGVHIRGESGYVDLLNKGNLDLLREAAYIGRNP